MIYTRLQEEQARALVEKYNQEGQVSKPPPKRSRPEDSRSRGRDGRDGRDKADIGRGRRDDFHRSPNDDNRRRDYRYFCNFLNI